eukprot:gene42055-51341_t
MSAFIKILLSVCIALALALGADVSGMDNKMDANQFKADPTIINTNGVNATSYGWTEYKQCDSRWANQQLG